jgi:hypothetical protein
MATENNLEYKLKDQKLKRIEFMKRLYSYRQSFGAKRYIFGNQMVMIALDMKHQFGFIDNEEIWEIAKYLEGEGLIQRLDTFKAAITHEGVKYVEQLLLEENWGDEFDLDRGKYLRGLLNVLDKRFDESELRELYLASNVEYGGLETGGKRVQMRALIEYFNRRDILSKLIELISEIRPDIQFDGDLLVGLGLA